MGFPTVTCRGSAATAAGKPFNATRTYGSLFAGAGGVDLGFDSVGWTSRWQVEIDPAATAVLERHWPDTTRHADVCTVNGADVEPVDVIVGGFPCQDLSVAGKRAGLDGARSGLFFEFVRIVEEMRRATDGLRPCWAVWENVAGLLSTRGALAACYARWDQAGAMVQEHRLVDGRYFGVPQRRRRVLGVVGFDPRAERVGPILADTESVRRDTAPVGSPRPTDTGHSPRSARSRGIAADAGIVTSLSASFRFGPDAAHAQAGWIVPVFAFNGFNGLNAQQSRDVTPTIRANAGGAGVPQVVDVTGARRLTPRECERLMGWPDDHTRWRADGTELANSHRYRLCGNGVIAPMAAWLAARIDRAWEVIAAAPT